LLAAMVAAFLALACASLNSFNSVLVISCTRHIISPAPTSPTHVRRLSSARAAASEMNGWRRANAAKLIDRCERRCGRP
jgi:hypothetical protein